jgi:hypothetical protein
VVLCRVEYILQHGVSVDQPYPVDVAPLYAACLGDNREVLKLIVKAGASATVLGPTKKKLIENESNKAGQTGQKFKRKTY